jgi:hypothetical protein
VQPHQQIDDGPQQEMDARVQLVGMMDSFDAALANFSLAVL